MISSIASGTQPSPYGWLAALAALSVAGYATSVEDGNDDDDNEQQQRDRRRRRYPADVASTSPYNRWWAPWPADSAGRRSYCETNNNSHQATTTKMRGAKTQHTMFTKSLEMMEGELNDDDQGHAETTADRTDESGHDGGGDGDGDDYPNFSRHGASALLPQYLTRDVFDKLKNKETRNGVRLEDLIRSGVCLPHGARPPRGMAGVYAGDAESYRTFAPLLMPLIKDNLHYGYRYQRHETVVDGHSLPPSQPRQPRAALSPKERSQRLQRHESNLNYKQLIKDQLDAKGEYILYTRMRLARSIQGFRFAPCMSRSERRKIEALLKDCVKDFSDEGGKYVSVMEMTNAQHDDLIQRRILFQDPDDFAISAGLGRDWPDARGLYCDTWDDMPAVLIWCNAEDHLWIISNAKGSDMQGVFTKLSRAVGSMESALKRRGYAFVEDRRLGFLNTSPGNIGTALRASVYVKLVRLSRQPGFFDLIRRLRLEANSEYTQSDKRFTGIYDIANAEALGKSEVDLINIMIKGVGVLIELEKRLEKGENVDLAAVVIK